MNNLTRKKIPFAVLAFFPRKEELATVNRGKEEAFQRATTTSTDADSENLCQRTNKDGGRKEKKQRTATAAAAAAALHARTF